MDSAAGNSQTETIKNSSKCDICQTLHCILARNNFECHVCLMKFTCQSVLRKHTSSHNGEKQVNCDICQKIFKSKSNLNKHIRIHTGQKPFKCDICQKKFNQKFSLIEHMRVHTGEKPFQCVFCKKEFNVKCNLIKHIKLHTDFANEECFECHTCQKKFTSEKKLLKHKTIFHSVEKVPKRNPDHNESISKNNFTHNHNIKIEDMQDISPPIDNAFESVFVKGDCKMQFGEVEHRVKIEEQIGSVADEVEAENFLDTTSLPIDTDFEHVPVECECVLQFDDNNLLK